jgi:hypothetical protein
MYATLLDCVLLRATVRVTQGGSDDHTTMDRMGDCVRSPLRSVRDAGRPTPGDRVRNLVRGCVLAGVLDEGESMNSKQWAAHLKAQRDAQARVAPTHKERTARSYGTRKTVVHEVDGRERSK